MTTLRLHGRPACAFRRLVWQIERNAMFPKAYRWVAEMEQIAEFIADPATGTVIYEGAARLYEAIAADLMDGQPHDRFISLTRFRPPSSS